MQNRARRYSSRMQSMNDSAAPVRTWRKAMRVHVGDLARIAAACSAVQSSPTASSAASTASTLSPEKHWSISGRRLASDPPDGASVKGLSAAPTAARGSSA